MGNYFLDILYIYPKKLQFAAYGQFVLVYMDTSIYFLRTTPSNVKKRNKYLSDNYSKKTVCVVFKL